MGRTILSAMAIVCGLIMFCASAGAGEIWYVDDDAPANFSTIQAALDAATDGDTIIVRDGYYTGAGNRDIDFQGKAVHLKSENGPENCIIDAQGTQAEPHKCFDFSNSSDWAIEGFTLTGGSHGGLYCVDSSGSICSNTILLNTGGSGINCYRSAAIIADNSIEGNNGYGISCSYSPLEISGNTVRGNAAGGISGNPAVIIDNLITGNTGTGIYGSPDVISDNLVTENVSLTRGGGIFCSTSTVVITENLIAANTSAVSGGGIYSSNDSSPIITNNRIIGNMANGSASDGNGGGLFVDAAGADIRENVILGNTSTGRGGGVHLKNGAVIHSSVIAENTCDNVEGGAAVYLWKAGAKGCTLAFNGNGYGCTVAGYQVAISDCIFWGNDVFSEILGIEVSIRYSNLPGGKGMAMPEATESAICWGAGNVDVDPLFVDPQNGDYHLKSKFGRWDPAANGGTGGWVYDSVTSPCIDAGAEWSCYDQEPLPHGSRVNMGAYGNTAEASKSGWVLKVQSSPMSGLGVTGTGGGVTGYEKLFRDKTEVSLRAPQTVQLSGVAYSFQRWVLDGQELSRGVTAIQVIMDGAHEGTAVYDFPDPPAIPTDVNGDCIVNILDLLEVRNSIGERCSE